MGGRRVLVAVSRHRSRSGRGSVPSGPPYVLAEWLAVHCQMPRIVTIIVQFTSIVSLLRTICKDGQLTRSPTSSIRANCVRLGSERIRNQS